MIQLPARRSSGPSLPVQVVRPPAWALAAALTLLLASGCSSSRLGGTVYVHPNADLAVFERVAVLPLENLSTDRFAAERVREVLNVELAAMGVCEVVDTTRVNRVLRDREVIDVTSLAPDTLIQIAEDLEVQAVLMGSVLELGQTRTSTFAAPEVSLSLRLVDAQTGIVAWSVTDARKGLPLETRLFGVGEKTQTEVIRELVRTLMSDLYQAAGS